MKLTIQELKDLCLPILTKQGLSQEDAETVFSEYLDGELRGRECHGLFAFTTFGNKIINSDSKEEVIKDEASLLYINGKGNLGQLVCNKFVPKLIEKAKNNNIAMMGILNMGSYLMPGTYARMIAENDLICFIFNYGGTPRIVPHGSIEPIFGANPLAISIPNKGFPIVVDYATSASNMGKVRLAKNKGTKVLPNACLDKDGKETINPEEVVALLPFGGYKGYALALTAEILSKTMFNITEKGKRGYFFMAINPAAFQNIEEFKDNVFKLIENIKSAKKAEGVKEIFVPGERSERLKQENLKKGYLKIDEKIVNEIKGMI